MGVVRLPVVTGPTASGKSALVTALAREMPVTVISADSRQVYRGFDIGTAKPTPGEQREVPHALIDVADPRERWNAARWADAATVAIRQAREAGRIPVVVGGTGLYLRALFEPLFEEPVLDGEARAELAARLEPLPTETLRERVALLDPPRAHLGRTQLLRALEVAELTGRPITWWHTAAPRSASFVPRYLVVQAADAAVRIEARVNAMLAAGWLDEVGQLAAEVEAGAPAWNATGYAEMRAVVAGQQSLGEARRAVVIATRQYAKRQRTWCRHQLPADAVRVDPNEPEARTIIGAWWQESLA